MDTINSGDRPVLCAFSLGGKKQKAKSKKQRFFHDFFMILLKKQLANSVQNKMDTNLPKNGSSGSQRSTCYLILLALVQVLFC
jgi:hypothetical protein